MGYSSYSTDSRSLRSETMNFMSVGTSKAATDSVFTQNLKRACHEMMSPKGLKFRECFDSEAHPNTVPIIVGLDVTGSMGRVPEDFCREGLPTMMSTIIQRGTPDAAVCFVAIGDHECDKAPIQVGQFESGDAELDMWLTRTWIEKGGGGNDGESYSLPWYFAARHTKIDSCSKRSVKGFLFTVGDEPILPVLPASALLEIFGSAEGVQGSISSADILKEAQKCYNVYHIALGHRGESTWKKLLGQNYILCDDYTKVPSMIADIVNSFNLTVIPTTSVPVSEAGTVML